MTVFVRAFVWLTTSTVVVALAVVLAPRLAVGDDPGVLLTPTAGPPSTAAGPDTSAPDTSGPDTSVPVALIVRTAAGPADLVPLDQGQHRLRPVARDGFFAWQHAFGGPIVLTDSWRSPSQQAECRRRKPTLCATPTRSWHVRGLAVDVDLGRTGAADPDVDQRLARSAAATGWCRPNPAEPWHFSFGGCG